MRIQEIASNLSGLIPKEKIFWAASEADINGNTFLVFKLKPEGSTYIEGVNLIIKYIPLREEVLWGRLEFVISPSIEAAKFMENVYPKLISLGYKVVVDSEGVFASYKLGQEINESIITQLYEKLCKLLSNSCGTLIFRSVIAVGEG